MRWRLSTLLAVLIAGIFYLAVLILALALRLGIESGFQTWLDTAQAAAHGRIMGALEALQNPDGTWDRRQVADLGFRALDEGLVLGLKDASGATVWDARAENPGAVAAVFTTLNARLKSRSPWETGRWEPWEHGVEAPGGGRATMVLEVFQPRRLGPADLAFLQGIDALLGALALVGLALGLVAGPLAARALTRPMDRIGQTAARLSAGDHTPPSPSQSPVAEVRNLEDQMAVLAGRLGRLQALRDTSGADTAHELRTPLANLEAQLEALEDGVLAPSADRFASLGLEVRRLRDLVQAWEELERARHPSGPAASCPDPAETVRRAVDTFRTRTGARGQGLDFRQEGVPGPVSLAEADLTRIVVNLVENAHRHTPEGGRIEVTWGQGPEAAQLTVDDSGPGIPPEHRDAVFDRFYRVDPSRTRTSGGLGLGLSLVKALAEGAGGEVRAGESPLGGCRIEVRLPGAQTT